MGRKITLIYRWSLEKRLFDGERERFIWENILNHAMREFYRYGDINYVEFN